jgi:putative CocE/NonD family hydrolase
MYRDALDHPSYDSFWRALSVRERVDQVKVPVFAVGGWYDNYAQSDLEAFAALRKTSPSNRVLVGPWPHNMSYAFADANFGPDSGAPIRSLQIAWFDRWLKGKEEVVAQESPARVFVMGVNTWRDEEEWPPADARARRFFLSSAGSANSLDGDGVLFERPPARSAPASDQFVFDPRDPVPTRGGAVCCNPKIFPWGPMDQRPVERRLDVLVYTTAPLRQDVTAIGPVEVLLWVSTSAKDTDFTAKLVDVFPDGNARNLTDGMLRLRYRNSLTRPEPAVPGQVYRVAIDAGVTANVFLKGHRIRVEISSSNFPRFDRNPNTGGVVANETRLLKATQTVYHDRERPSQLVLMAMPADRSVSANSAPTTPRKPLR